MTNPTCKTTKLNHNFYLVTESLTFKPLQNKLSELREGNVNLTCVLQRALMPQRKTPQNG